MTASKEGARIRNDYAVAFHRYRSREEEAALHSAYEIGRDAVMRQLSLFELAEIHHSVLFDALRGAADSEFEEIAVAAPQFFVEILATFEMATRGFREQARRESP
jgi:Phosphoserine phosphatase RsbU, N-terminal domain